MQIILQPTNIKTFDNTNKSISTELPLMKRSVKPLQSIFIPKFILQLNLRQINIDNQLLQPLGY